MDETHLSKTDEAFLAYAKANELRVDAEKGRLLNRDNEEVARFNKKRKSFAFSVYLYDEERKIGVGCGISRARAIWLLLKGPIPKGYGVGHVSSNLCDDSINNLELNTTSDRSKKAMANGWLLAHRIPASKITLEQVNEARLLCASDPIKYNSLVLSEKYQVSRRTMTDALTGASWQNATAPTVNLRKLRYEGQKRPNSVRERRLIAKANRELHVSKAPKPAGKTKNKKPKAIDQIQINFLKVAPPTEDAYVVAKRLLSKSVKISNQSVLSYLRLTRVKGAETFPEKQLTRIREELRV